ncbi:splicing factor, Prp19-binding domain-containing protein [Ampelomyces quisqualis]|uniref:Splicing factor, Prp19-binding domain-containing protein n=1 Tax=Ampelomyces quisqualis TaxID=50730 RepID=A0A6A5QS03_AMPQU|nr:splicing factor, Prp19-binding domain-containing protein [Ampelomyces quisqualis]
MPLSRSRNLTAQPVRTRQFAGKPAAVEAEERSSSESESEEEQPQQKSFAKPKPAPAASSFPKSAFKSRLAARQKTDAERKALEDEFETESEEETGEDGGASGTDGSNSSDDASSEEESSSEEEEEEPKKLLRPVFLKKNERNKAGAPKSAEEVAAEEEARRQEQARALVQEQVEQRAAERAAGKKDWDDDVEDADINAIDDTDGLDPDAEYAAWKLRELKRIKRERLAIEEAEAERAEIERRRNLSAAERAAEDRAFIEQQKEERGDRGDMQYMQKYFHKGAFFTDELKELGVDRRNLMGARFEDQTNREVLPEFMQIRDMTKLGKKGRTRYKDMKSEDTGQWGDYGHDRPRRDKVDYGVDERFRPDSYGSHDADREGATGANAKPLGERKRFGDDRDTNRDSKRPRTEGRA